MSLPRAEAGARRSSLASNRAHRLACPSSSDRRSGRRCRCPFQIQVPDARPGRRRFVSIAGTVGEARAERRRLLAAGRPEPAPDAPVLPSDTLDAFAGDYLRAKAAVLAPATIYTTEESYRLPVSPGLGAVRLEEITRERVEVWLAQLVLRASSRRIVTKTVEALRERAADVAVQKSLREGFGLTVSEACGRARRWLVAARAASRSSSAWTARCLWTRSRSAATGSPTSSRTLLPGIAMASRAGSACGSTS